MAIRNLVLNLGSGSDIQAVSGHILINRHTAGSTDAGLWIFDSPERVVLTNPARTVPLEVGVAYRFAPVIPEGTTIYAYMTAGAGDLNYLDLVPVDPSTLTPAASPEAAWWATADANVVDGAVVGDDLILTRYNGSTTNAGNVRGVVGPAGADGSNVLPTETAMANAVTSGGAFQTASDGKYATLTDTYDKAASDGKFVVVNEAPISPYRYGFIGDGVADETAALQATIDATPDGGTLRLPHVGNAEITSPLSITRAITIDGGSRELQRIHAIGCNGFEVAAGVDSVRLRDFEIATGTSYATTPNSFVGVNVDGTTADHPSEHLYENIFCQGFHTAFRTRYLWSSSFVNVRTLFGLIGIDAYGKSVNNFVGGGSRLSVEKVTDSRGIRLFGRESFTDATVVASEGWVIDKTLTYGAEIGIDLLGVNHVYVSASILDFNQLYGLRSIHNGIAFGNNVSLSGSYVAMDGTVGSGVLLGNTVANAARRYARIIGNEFTVYSTKVAEYGVRIAGSEARAMVESNTFTNFAINDVAWSSPDQIIRGNTGLSSVAKNFSGAGVPNQPSLVADNIGIVNRPGTGPETQPYRTDPLGRKVAMGTGAPAAGTWGLGDHVTQSVPAVGSPKGWACTVAGTPGTWVSEGNL